jgi:CheY-like chemotaxis protein
MTTSLKQVLLVEDTSSDVMLMQLALKKSGAPIELKVAEDGAEAMDYLRGQGRFSGAARPALVLLDWRLPRMSGEEVLREVRKDPVLRLIPVIVLTSSAAAADVRTAYSLGANAYLTKPNGLDELQALISAIAGFWLIFATLPPRNA